MAERLRELPESAIWEPGLGADEFISIQERLGIVFADDHRALVAARVPTGGGWPNWRHRW